MLNENLFQLNFLFEIRIVDGALSNTFMVHYYIIILILDHQEFSVHHQLLLPFLE